MLNEILLLQTLLLINVYFYLIVLNILMLWYLAGIYLFNVGWLGLCDDSDIFVGFLWIIDLGVGLIFFLFILHFSHFLHQKILNDVIHKLFVLIFIFMIFYKYFLQVFFQPNNNLNSKTWSFDVSWYNYYDFFLNNGITELNLLREIYFFNNSFEFFLINFMLLYGLFLSITFTFLIKRVFNILTFSQLNNSPWIKKIQTFFFIRNQNFIKQQNTSTGTRVWEKKKYNLFNDFSPNLG